MSNQLSNSNGLINFIGLNVEKLQNIQNQQKELIIQLNDKIANLNKNFLSWENCFEYSMREESKYVLEFSLTDFENLHSVYIVKIIWMFKFEIF